MMITMYFFVVKSDASTYPSSKTLIFKTLFQDRKKRLGAHAICTKPDGMVYCLANNNFQCY